MGKTRHNGMKRGLAGLMAGLLMLLAGSGMAEKTEYTFTVKGGTVLQNDADRAMTPGEAAAAREAVPGESPVTGLPWTGAYLPMLVQIDNSMATVKINGRNVKTSGVGKYAPWGLQYADVIYEEMMSATGSTRFTALFSDCFAQGQPAEGVGPVRSCRNGPLMLRAQWQAGLVFQGGFAGFQWSQLLGIANVVAPEALIDTRSGNTAGMRRRIAGKKSPANLSVDLVQMREGLMGKVTSTPHPFLFKDERTAGGAYAAAAAIHLDWGNEASIAHFLYDESENAYRRYCGPGTKPAKWALFAAFTVPEDKDEADQTPLGFANVIVQRVTYTREDNSKVRLNLQTVGTGNADIFIDGVYIPGYWVCAAPDAPTVFYDDQGAELRLNRGKTYIAQFPGEALCVFEAE